jgi:hypothetical protein
VQEDPNHEGRIPGERPGGKRRYAGPSPINFPGPGGESLLRKGKNPTPVVVY